MWTWCVDPDCLGVCVKSGISSLFTMVKVLSTYRYQNFGGIDANDRARSSKWTISDMGDLNWRGTGVWKASKCFGLFISDRCRNNVKRAYTTQRWKHVNYHVYWCVMSCPFDAVVQLPCWCQWELCTLAILCLRSIPNLFCPWCLRPIEIWEYSLMRHKNQYSVL